MIASEMTTYVLRGVDGKTYRLNIEKSPSGKFNYTTEKQMELRVADTKGREHDLKVWVPAATLGTGASIKEIVDIVLMSFRMAPPQ
jgi:hypothetical protein